MAINFFYVVFYCIIVGIIFSFYKRKEKPISNDITFTTTDNILYESVFSSVNSILFVGGLITVFYLLTEVMLSLNLLSPLISLVGKVIKSPDLSKGLIVGLFENTRGIQIISGERLNFLSLPLSAVLCGFGGVSVILQSTAILKKAKIKTAPFLIAKVISAVVNFSLALIIQLIFGF